MVHLDFERFGHVLWSKCAQILRTNCTQVKRTNLAKNSEHFVAFIIISFHNSSVLWSNEQSSVDHKNITIRLSTNYKSSVINCKVFVSSLI